MDITVVLFFYTIHSQKFSETPLSCCVIRRVVRLTVLILPAWLVSGKRIFMLQLPFFIWKLSIDCKVAKHAQDENVNGLCPSFKKTCNIYPSKILIFHQPKRKKT